MFYDMYEAMGETLTGRSILYSQFPKSKGYEAVVKTLQRENEKLKAELEETKKELEEAKKGHSEEVGRVHLSLVVDGVEETVKKIRNELLNNLINPVAVGCSNYYDEYCIPEERFASIMREYSDHTEIEKKLDELIKVIRGLELDGEIDNSKLANLVIEISKKKEAQKNDKD